MYEPNSKRYLTMTYNRCGKSGLKLPAVSLGLWHNFGDTADYENMKALVFTAFDNGIPHFDLANNYGPAPGSAEKNFGKILKEELSSYRDELIISTKAGANTCLQVSTKALKGWDLTMWIFSTITAPIPILRLKKPWAR